MEGDGVGGGVEDRDVVGFRGVGGRGGSASVFDTAVGGVKVVGGAGLFGTGGFGIGGVGSERELRKSNAAGGG